MGELSRSSPIRVLVTGAGGQLGLTLQNYFGDEEGIDWIFKSSKDLDISDSEAIATIFGREQLEVCINCAAYTNVEKAESEPEEVFRVNAEAVKGLALQCKIHDTVLIHISTDYVFDGTKGSPYTPEDVPNPLNVYGKSKLAGERYIQGILKKYYIVRTSWLYSKDFGNNFYRTILDKGKAGEDLKVVDDQVGCPTDTMNLSKRILELIKGNEPFGIKHFCDGKAVNWYEFAKILLSTNGIDASIMPVHSSKLKQKAKRPEYSVLAG